MFNPFNFFKPKAQPTTSNESGAGQAENTAENGPSQAPDEAVDKPEGEKNSETVEVKQSFFKKIAGFFSADNPARNKIIAGATYKTVASIAGVKSIIDWVGAGAGLLGLKAGQRTDVYKFFEQNKTTAEGRQQVDGALRDLIEAARSNREFMNGLYLSNDYKDLVRQTDELLVKYKEEGDPSKQQELRDQIKSVGLLKQKMASDFRSHNAAPEKAADLAGLAENYNKVIDNSRSAAYYNLPKDQRRAIDNNWEAMSKEDKQRYQLAEHDVMTMKQRLGGVLVDNFQKKGELKKKRSSETDNILRDYISGQVKASSLIKDGLNTAFVLGGGIAAGGLRGLAYGAMSMAERVSNENREQRKEYSWNEIGQKMTIDRRLHDIFIGSMRETLAGLSGKKLVKKYEINKTSGKLERKTDQVTLQGIEKTAQMAKSYGEILRLFGIGTQGVTSVITEGANFGRIIESFENTFTKGNVAENMLHNCYQNIRFDQRISQSIQAIKDRFLAGQAVVNQPLAPQEQVVDYAAEPASQPDEVIVVNKPIDTPVANVVNEGAGVKLSESELSNQAVIDNNPDVQVDIPVENPEVDSVSLDDLNVAEQPENQLLDVDQSVAVNPVVDQLPTIEISNPDTLTPVNLNALYSHATEVGDGGVAVALGHDIPDGQKVTILAFKDTGHLLVYQKTDPAMVVAGARIIEQDGQLIAIDQDPQHIDFYEQHCVDNAVANDQLEVPNNLAANNQPEALSEDVVVNNNAGNPAEVADNTAVRELTYSNDPRFALSTSKFSYDDLVKGDAKTYHDFVLADRPGGINSTGTEDADHDLESDIDRVYYNNDLTPPQRIDILSGIKAQLDNPELTSHIKSESLRENIQGAYKTISNSIDHDIVLLERRLGTPLTQDELGSSDGAHNNGADIAASLNKADATANGTFESAFDDLESNESAQQALVDPNNSFVDKYNALIKAVPDKGNTNIGTIQFSRIGDQLFANNRPFTENSYQEIILGHAKALNGLTSSPEFKSLVETDDVLRGKSVELTDRFEEMNAVLDVHDKFIDPAVAFEDKIAAIKNSLPEGKSMTVQDLTFVRLHDKVYLMTSDKNSLELSSAEVVSHYLQIRQRAMSQILSSLKSQ